MVPRRFQWLWLAFWFGAVMLRLPAQTYPPGEPLIGVAATAWRLTSSNATVAQVDVAGQPFTSAWRVETRVDSSPSYAIEFKTPVTRAVTRGDVALLRFFARAVATTDESGAAYLRLVVQKASTNWDKSLESLHTLTREWTEFFVPFAFGAEYAPGASEVAFGLPVRITEFDMNTDDEELQADYTRDFLIAVFSHPAVVGFQLWGF